MGIEEVFNNDNYKHVPEAAVAFEGGRRVGELESGVRVEIIEGVPHLIVPKGLEVRDMSALLPAPQRHTGAYSFQEPDSFCEFVNTYKGGGTTISCAAPERADGNAVFVATIDGHQKEKAGHEDFSATLRLPPSDDFLAFFLCSIQPLSQIEFVRLLRDRLECVVEPDASSICAAFADFSSCRKSVVSSRVPLVGGNYEITVSEEVRGGTTRDQTIKIPEQIILRLPLFRHGNEAIDLTALVNWQSGNNGLLFSLAFPGLERIYNAEFLKLRAQISELTGLYVYR